MRRMALIFAAAAVTTGAITGGQGVLAAQLHETAVQQPAVVDTPQSRLPAQMMDCFGTTGGMGCGPGWVWRDGWRGWACYPC
jgi:hypothetical protein